VRFGRGSFDKRVGYDQETGWGEWVGIECLGLGSGCAGLGFTGLGLGLVNGFGYTGLSLVVRVWVYGFEFGVGCLGRVRGVRIGFEFGYDQGSVWVAGSECRGDDATGLGLMGTA